MAADRHRAEPEGFERAAKVADAVLWEGYVLYPYRASALKNQMRWQFGVLAPPSAADRSQTSSLQVECLVDPGEGIGIADLTVRARFLQVLRRDGGEGAASAWEEGVLREFDTHATLLPGAKTRSRFEFPGQDEGARHSLPLSGVVRTEVSPAGGTGLLRVRIRVENHTPGRAVPRSEMLLGSLVGTHALLALSRGVFLSLTDPPERAAGAAAACDNRNTWPVLIDDATMLSAPIILGDHPAVAPESRADLCDATEIDELLLLRTMTLTDEEKRQARATDERAAAIVDLAEALDPAELVRLHGTMRRDGPAGGTGAVDLPGGSVVPGSTVRLRPRSAADAQDMFLRDRLATVREIRVDVDGRTHLAVTLDDDPGADLQAATGRFRYFAPDEVELP